MKKLFWLLPLILAVSENSEASFGISDFRDWAQLEKSGIELTYFLRVKASPDGDPLKYYAFTLKAPVVCKELPGQNLHRIDFWKDDRSTEIPMESREIGKGMRLLRFSVSVADLKNASVVLRFGEPNSSAEIGWRLHLLRLIETKKSSKPE